MICIVDTSVLVSLHRQRETPLGRTIIELAAKDEAAICGPVLVEFLGGFSSPERRRREAERLAAFRWLPTSDESWQLAADLLGSTRKISPGDAVIAAMCIIQDAELLTLNRGFNNLRAKGLRLRSLG